jgi:hypothetical protein
LARDGDKICSGEWAAAICSVTCCSVIGTPSTRELLSRDWYIPGGDELSLRGSFDFLHVILLRYSQLVLLFQNDAASVLSTLNLS